MTSQAIIAIQGIAWQRSTTYEARVELAREPKVLWRIKG
jgi:hypothetical protein